MNVPEIDLYSYGASRALKLEGTTDDLHIQTNKNTIENTDIRIFGKHIVNGSRRVGVLLSKDKSIEQARNTTKLLLDYVTITPENIEKNNLI